MSSQAAIVENARKERRRAHVPLVSVIVPTHNSLEHLAECLDSIVGQTLTDLEAIIVDDCSTDESVAMVEEYSRRDQRVRLIKLEKHGGPGVARNRGIDAARGTYLYFLDSDDYCDISLLEKAVKRLEKTGGDLCAFPFYRLEMRVGRPVRAWWCLPPESMFEGTRTWQDYPDAFFSTYQNYAWNKVYRRSLIEQHAIRFQDELHLTEDLMFTAVALVRARGIAVLDEPLVTHREGTYNNTMANKDAHPLDFVTAFLAFKRFLEAEGFMEGLESSYLNWAANACFYNQNTLSSSEAFHSVFANLAQGSAKELGLPAEGLESPLDERYNWLLDALSRNDQDGYLFRIYRNVSEELEKRDVQLAVTYMDLDRTRFERDSARQELDALREDYNAKMNAAEQRVGQAICKIPRFVQRTLFSKKSK